MFILENGLGIVDYPLLLDPSRALSHSPEEINKLAKQLISVCKKHKWTTQ